MTLDDVDTKLTLYKIIRATCLDVRSLRILIRRWGLDGQPAMTLREVSDLEPVSVERVRQIEAKAIRKMRWTRAYRALVKAIGPPPIPRWEREEQAAREAERAAERAAEPSPQPTLRMKWPLGKPPKLTFTPYLGGNRVVAVCDVCWKHSDINVQRTGWDGINRWDGKRIRQAMRKENWECGPMGDRCPRCAGEQAAKKVIRVARKAPPPKRSGLWMWGLTPPI